MDQPVNFWLQELCKTIDGVTRAIVFSTAKDKEEHQAVAYFPDTITDVSGFEKIAGEALSAQKIIQIKDYDRKAETGEHLDLIASPLWENNEYKRTSRAKSRSALVLQMTSRTGGKLEKTVQAIEASIPWLGAIKGLNSTSNTSHLVNIIELVACCLEHDRFETAATEVVTELTNRFSCDRISIGLKDGASVAVEAISHSGGFDKKSSLIRGIGEAMYEAIDQDNTIIYPSSGSDFHITRYHKTLSEEHRIGSILTVPFIAGEEIAGALMLERSAAGDFSHEAIEFAEHVASLIGPILYVRYRDEQWLPVRFYNSLKSFFSHLFGPGKVGFKLTALVSIGILVFLSLATADYRVAGDAKLEAIAQRVIVAPMDGYIAEASARPGDIVTGGELLGALDDKDLQLQHSKASSQLGQLKREYRDALAKHDRSRVSIINAKIQKVNAELHLIGEQLERTRFLAPFDGVIVSGDLSQSLGAPVERGQVLFTTAPLLAYRVVLKVDERDIGRVQKGQNGSLVLSAMANVAIPFHLERITPVSIAEEGRNYFFVEAKIEENSDLLRPGMEGVGKILIERKKLIWIVSHKLVDWFRLTFWSWLP